MEKLYIVMPAYNEEANIKSVVEEWYPILELGNEESKLVVADGGSEDNTLKILNDMKNEYPKLDVLSYPGTDHGTKVLILYSYAIKNKADWIFQTDSDGQTRSDEFKAFWNLRKDYDAVIGNRKKRGDGFLRKKVELVLRLYVKFYFGIMVPDAGAPFRLMKTNIVEKYINLMPNNFNLPNAVFTACFAKHEKTAFREITFLPRQGGENFMNMKRIFKIGVQTFGGFSKVRKKLKEYEKNN